MSIVHRRIAAVVLASACVVSLDAQSPPGATSRVSVASNGAQGTLPSQNSGISADGRYVAFSSAASNLVAGDTNGAWDIFVHDRDTGITTRVSVATDGSQGDGDSAEPAMSADGRYVVYYSLATNLVAGDNNSAYDVFLHDRDTRTTTRVSVATGGAEGNGHSYQAAISADGRTVTFASEASNLVAGDTNGWSDIFVHDRDSGTTTRVSVATEGTQANGSSYVPVITAAGRTIAFVSTAGNLVAGDTNGTYDVFVHDRDTSTTTRVSVATGGAQGNGGSYSPSISADGRTIAFDSEATSLVVGDTNAWADVFVRDRDAETTTRISVAPNGDEGNGYSFRPSISADGRFVAFASNAGNIVAGDTNGVIDIFLRDRASSVTTRLSVGSGGTQGDGDSLFPLVSPDGRTVAFSSSASNMVVGDTNGVSDVLVHALAALPGAPKGLTADASGATVTLSWREPAGGGAPLAYRIEAGTAPGLSDLANFSTGHALTAYSANGVANGLYFLRVRATNVGGTSGPSNEVQLRVGPAPPDAPTGLSASAVGSTVTLSWSAAAGGGTPTAYRIEAGSAPGLLDLANFSTATATTSYSTGGVSNGTYYIRVRATNAVGASDPSNETVLQVGPAPPGPPSGLTASAVGSSITLSWVAPTTGGTPTSYLVRAGSAPGLVNVANIGIAAPATTFSASGVSAGGYYLRIWAVNAYGTSLPSNEVLLCVGCAALPGAPVAWQTTVPQPNGVLQMQWTAASGSPTSYTLDAGSAPGLSDMASINVGNTLVFNVSGVANGTYYLHIHGTNLCGVGPASNVVKVIMF